MLMTNLVRNMISGLSKNLHMNDTNATSEYQPCKSVHGVITHSLHITQFSCVLHAATEKSSTLLTQNPQVWMRSKRNPCNIGPYRCTCFVLYHNLEDKIIIFSYCFIQEAARYIPNEPVNFKDGVAPNTLNRCIPGYPFT